MSLACDGDAVGVTPGVEIGTTTEESSRRRVVIDVIMVWNITVWKDTKSTCVMEIDCGTSSTLRRLSSDKLQLC